MNRVALLQRLRSTASPGGRLCFGHSQVGLRHPQQRDRFHQRDGRINRDFVHVSDVVQANILAATTENSQGINQVFNIGTGFRTTLNELIEMFKAVYPDVQPVYRAPRVGDAHDSCANIDNAVLHLGYQPANSLQSALNSTLKWYEENL